MGLLLSVLVACVGVIELISFYSNVKRNLTLLPVRRDLSVVRESYRRELSDFRKRAGCDQSALKENNVSPCDQSGSALNENNVSASCERHVPTFRLISHEDIEVEYKANVVASGSSNPRRFLVTEKELNDKRRSPSPRQFVISEEPQGIRKSQCKTSIPEFFFQEEKNSKKSPNRPRYVLKDQEGRSGSPIPLPSQFLITEKESDALESTDTSSDLSGPKSDYEQEEHYRRSPSPYPPLDLPQVPRNSISNELLDDSVISLLEVDEDLYHSRSPSPRNNTNATIQIQNETFNSITALNLQNISSIERDVLAATAVIERARSILGSEDSHSNVTAVQKTVYTSQTNGKECTDSGSSFEVVEEDFLENSSFDETYLNNLDGIGKQKSAKRNYSSRKSVKRLTVNKSIEEQSCSNSDESSKCGNSNISVQDVKSLECLSPNSNDQESSMVAGSSKEPEIKKEPEPFWLIFSGEYTKAMNKDWHGQHFCCWQCDESLTGQRYVLRDDHPYCVSCYESVFANACEKCSRTIGIDSKDLSYKDKHWHEACFLCTTCGESLVDKQFGSKGDRIYCGSCYDQQFASRCDGCHEIFRAGTKKMEYKTRQWHEKCFCCCVCKVPIGTQSFIPREQEIYCAKCYEEKFATRCIKCNKVITSGGVTYKNEPWHRECFTCTHCQKSLAGERFTSRDEKPFCAECFGELFAKRCTACNKPITGIGGTKFISFEDRHWHNDCFFCASCRTSLVGRGFITDNEDIICPECAKQKLM